MGFDKHDRIEKILTILRENSRASVRDLADLLNTTEITIRRDLRELNDEGLIKRVYGGALLNQDEESLGSIAERMTHNIEAKRRIGKKAAELINDGDVVYIDPGTTCWEIVAHLAQKSNLTIIINSSRLAHAFRNEKKHRIIYLGGEYRPHRMDIVGDYAEAIVEKMRGYKAFSGSDGIDIQLGLSSSDVLSAAIARKILQCASTAIFVGDSTKFDNPSLVTIVGIDALDFIVTDKPLSKTWEDTTKMHGVKVLYADQD